MLLSMTGFGEGHAERDGLSAAVEIRSINNRYLKINCRLPDGYGVIEPQLDALLRATLRRGTVQLNVKLWRQPAADEYVINTELVKAFFRQLSEMRKELAVEAPPRLEALLSLPGAVLERSPKASGEANADWAVIETATLRALEGLQAMRQSEGAAMAADLQANCQQIADCAQQIHLRAPQVVADYQRRLRDRLAALLSEFGAEVQAADIVREVGIFADRADVSEEIVRLRSHLRQFRAAMAEGASTGRQLEFLVQELLRETNTIGSKANDTQIAQQVVHIKTCIERMREMVQNIE